MTEDGSVYGEFLDAPDTGRGKTRRRGLTILVAGAAAVALVTAGVVLTRPGGPGGSAAPPSSPSPAADAPSAAARPPVQADDVLGRTGIGRIKLGMSGSDYRGLFADPAVETGEFAMSGVDEVRGCLQYADHSQAVPTSVWVRDNEVVSVAVAVYPRDHLQVATGFGATLGEEFDVPAGPAGWLIDPDAPVPVARLVEGGNLVTLADTQADGVLDFASVSSVTGDECQVDHTLWQTWPNDEVPAFEAGALLGLRVGMSVEQAEALPDWTRAGSRGSCSMYWGEEGGAAYAMDGVVVGLQPTRVLDGPSTGQTMAEAVAGIGIDRVHLGEPQQIDGWWTTELTVDGATTYRVRSSDPAVQLDGLDVAVMPPVAAGDRVIITVLLGDSCDAVWEVS